MATTQSTEEIIAEATATLLDAAVRIGDLEIENAALCQTISELREQLRQARAA